MSNRSFSVRAFQVATGLTLCTFAIASQADPYSLEGTCYVTSIVAGQGKCELSYSLTDDFQSLGSGRKAQIRVNNIIVAQYVNDSANPVQFLGEAGVTNVACGASYTVTAFVAKLAAPNYEKVGSLPPVACPAAP